MVRAIVSQGAREAGMASMDATSREGQVRALLEFDTATLFESAEHGGSMDEGLRPIATGFRFAGPALTVACPGGDNLMLHAAVADAQPGEVLVVQCHDASYGVWGEVLMTSALARGVVGLVIDGAVRDVDAMLAARFPVFCRRFALKGAAKRRRGLLRQPVSCAGVLVHPGDFVVADDSGIAVLDAATVDGVIAKARQRQAKERALMEQLRAKASTLDLLELRGYLSGDRGAR